MKPVLAIVAHVGHASCAMLHHIEHKINHEVILISAEEAKAYPIRNRMEDISDLILKEMPPCRVPLHKNVFVNPVNTRNTSSRTTRRDKRAAARRNRKPKR